MTWPPSSFRPETLSLDGRLYLVSVLRQVSQPPDNPRLIIASHLPTRETLEILRSCVWSLQRLTPEPHELWIVDNASPPAHLEEVLSWPRLNLVLNHTAPLPPNHRGWLARWRGKKQRHFGSYANAVALELGLRLIDPTTTLLMTLHQDILAWRRGWLSFLRSKLRGIIAAAGVRLERARTPEGVLHVLGLLVDFQLFRQRKLDFFPDLPRFDVGDRITVALREAGHGIFACPNTQENPVLAERLDPASPLRHLAVDRAFDDDRNPIFLHLGRGVRKTADPASFSAPYVTPEAWLALARRHLPGSPP